MLTAFIFLFCVAILIVCSIISLIIVIFVKNLKICKYILLTYFIITILLSILCGITSFKELSSLSNALHHSYTTFKIISDFSVTFLFCLFMYNIPSFIMLIIYAEKIEKHKQAVLKQLEVDQELTDSENESKYPKL